MAINFGSGFGMGSTPTSHPTDAILNLQKNDILDLTKREPGLTKVTLGAGWDVAQTGQDFDLDIAAFLLDANGKIDRGQVMQQVVFFNNTQVPGVQLMGDNRTGAGEGDDEEIRLDLSLIPAHISKVVFLVTIFEAAQRRQTFGMVENSYVRLLNPLKGDQEICRFNLREQGSTGTAVIFAELYRDGADWRFKAIGDTKTGDLNNLLALYM